MGLRLSHQENHQELQGLSVGTLRTTKALLDQLRFAFCWLNSGKETPFCNWILLILMALPAGSPCGLYRSSEMG